jgi:hypothetical protein
MAFQIDHQEFRPDQPAPYQLKYHIHVSWSAVNPTSIPRFMDFLEAFQAARFDMNKYQTKYLQQLPSNNPFQYTASVTKSLAPSF